MIYKKQIDISTLNAPLEFNIYGRQPILEALRYGDSVKKIWLASDLSGKPVRQIQNLAENKKIPLFTISKNDIQKYVGSVVHQGIAAQISFNPFVTEADLETFLQSKNNPLIVILDQVQDPHNLGAIIRTCEITGVDLIVLTAKGSAPINATVAKTSAGALFGVKLHQTENLLAVIDLFKRTGIQTFAATTHAEFNIYDADFKRAIALIIGSEGIGVRKNLLSYCDLKVTIPQIGKINSLNASVSASVILYEALRQRFYSNIRNKTAGNE
jgi:23S rRNA (guanosine2251-2'-O)-methyltransferase